MDWLSNCDSRVLGRRPIQQSLGLSGGVLDILATTTSSFRQSCVCTLLFSKMSGVPFSEAKYDKRHEDRKDYQEWKQSTPRLIPKLL